MTRPSILIRLTAVFGLALAVLFLLARPSGEEPPVSPPPPAETGSQALVFLALGDSGTGGTEQRTLAALMAEEEANLAIHTGDVVYPCGTPERYQANFADIYSVFLAVAPIYPSPGNHDYSCDGLASYLAFFAVSRFYSFDVEGIHFVSLDTNRIDQEQRDWLEADLAQSSAEVKIAFFHHPPFSSGSAHGGDQTVVQQLVPILEKYGVDLVFAGHEHNYERLVLGNTTYFVTGGGGAGIYQFADPVPGSQARLANYHYIRVRIEGCDAMTTAIRLDGTEFDPADFRVCESE